VLQTVCVVLAGLVVRRVLVAEDTRVTARVDPAFVQRHAGDEVGGLEYVEREHADGRVHTERAEGRDDLRKRIEIIISYNLIDGNTCNLLSFFV